jgi:micrococcal nuclease
MDQFNSQKNNLSKEKSRFFETIWTKNKLLLISGLILLVTFFIPYISILLAFIITPFFVWGFLKLNFINKIFTKQNKMVKFLLIPISLYTGFLIIYILFASIYSVSVSPVSNRDKQVTQQVAGVSEQDASRISELEQKAEVEEQKRIEAEKNKKELEIKIAEAQKINLEYDVESDLASQDPQIAVQANLAIAQLGRETKGQKLFIVTEVVDGDTIKVSELGTLRLIGMDTPETKDPRKPVQCFGVEASNRAKELLSGKNVYLEFDPANRIDKHGRTLAYVYSEDGFFFNAEMIKEGFAHSYTKFPHPKLEEFNGYAKSARENSLGFWSATTCNGDTTKSINQQPTPPVSISTSSSGNNSSTANSSVNNSTSGVSGGFIAGTCKFLKETYGIGNFLRGDPNYTGARDRDNDGVACEM